MNSSIKVMKAQYFISNSSLWPSQDELTLLQNWDACFFPSPWSLTQWLDLSHEKDYFLVTCSFGFALFRLSPLENLAHLLKILILPEKRTQGLGHQLFQFSLDELKRLNFERVYLEVEEDNICAQKLYERFGFKKLHLIKDFYGHERHAFSMELILSISV